jgi:hypothetical protein
MPDLTAAWAAWLAVAAAVLILLAAPVLIAAIRRVERISVVVLLTVLTLGAGPVTWIPALIAAFALPRSPQPGRRLPPAPPWPGFPPAAPRR